VNNKSAVSVIGSVRKIDANTGLSVCNQNTYLAEVAISSSKSGHKVVEGWWRIGAGSCYTIIINNPAGDIYATARVQRNNTAPKWGQGDAAFCVDYPGPFELNAEVPCESNKLAPFKKFQSGATWTLSPDP
jgi:uncharacterized membrane protein